MTLRRLIVITSMVAAAAALVPIANAQEPPEENTGAPECPTGLAGYAPETGGIFMSWTLRSTTDVNVYRSDGDGEFEQIDRLEFPATRYIDHDAEPGETYQYQVTAIDENGTESQPCGMIEVTAVPFFPSWIGMIGAVGVATAGYAFARRR